MPLSEKNVGLPQYQIHGFTKRIKNLTQHLQSNKKDHSAKAGLFRLIGKRKSLLKYLDQTNVEAYETICKNLSLHK